MKKGEDVFPALEKFHTLKWEISPQYANERPH